jgi:16S rRNA (cytosine967-C5)-methyltransferase
MILAAATAQLLLLGTPPHAVINLAVEQCRRDRLARRFDKLANAVLRRAASDGPAILASADTLRLDVPDWLWRRWMHAYGEITARLIAEASLREAPLDVSVKSDPSTWAGRLGGHLLPTGGVRLEPVSRVDELSGYAEGEWWVQDAAASLPARLLGDVGGLAVADLCAAPGGKTAELAAAGAHVTAVDASERRLGTLSANLKRLRLEDRVRVVCANVEAWEPAERFDAVLLDAPCTATGTIRRHPDILRLRGEDDVRRLAALQARLLARAAHFLKPGGTFVYSTCSLEPEEGQDQIERLLATTSSFSRIPIVPNEVANQQQWLTPSGDLRTLPHQLALDRPELSGLDGFYAARLKHRD